MCDSLSVQFPAIIYYSYIILYYFIVSDKKVDTVTRVATGMKMSSSLGLDTYDGLAFEIF